VTAIAISAANRRILPIVRLLSTDGATRGVAGNGSERPELGNLRFLPLMGEQFGTRIR